MSSSNRPRIDTADKAQSPEAPSLTPPTLETLPAELRLRILLSISDVADLRAVVRASPVLHQQYLLGRKKLLGHTLKKTLGSVFADAQALQAATSLADFGEDVPSESIRGVLKRHLDEYVAHRFEPDILAQCGVEDLVGIASFYLSVIQPLLVEVPALFLHRLDASLEVGHLSNTERIRLLRGLYRFQLFYDVFKCETTRGPRDPHFSSAEKLGMFFTIFEPYEVEEIHCVYLAMRAKYLRILEIVNPRVRRAASVAPPGDWDPTNCRCSSLANSPGCLLSSLLLPLCCLLA